MTRLTEPDPGCFEYRLKDHKSVPGEFGNYDAFFAYSMAVKRLGAYEETGLEPEDLAPGLNAAVRRKFGAEYYGLSCEEMDRAVDLFQADREGRVVVLPPVEDADTEGLTVKYRVYKARNGEPVENCFVLRPDKDSAAYHALIAYALHTDNETLRDDILAWAKKMPQICAETLAVLAAQEGGKHG